ncbi:PA0069 family radical SAM protein [Cupriavidus pauculus]|uniref:PA0069 family radical SAM protein n=1 Tax=Cupriavidus pauculus TaxID=82633 RepID=UPI001248DAF4|nr:PA0069 family radical SAM protein [Cupriavidus pauculus]KAB0604690.1 PA0069 family radical SAM protein [Cupriavidus pauculus]MCM3607121.1 PA0069 family radical SAM protein [Cupriavidus pauculus]UAK98875.1 PA0069 family radical SAM protein [Cupriavidus pauculus]
MPSHRHPPTKGPPTKGRGAVSNLQGRFERDQREAFDDGWLTSEAEPLQAGEGCRHVDGPAQPAGASSSKLITQVTIEQARSILTRNASPDIPFDVSLNPYRGCEHGCIYCFARPTHAYLDLSPGLDFESKLYAKANAAQRLREEISRPSYQCQTIALGVNTDAYQPIERTQRITRSVLEVLHETDHPVALITKSSLIERDVDLLAPMAARRLAVAAVTITTLDADIARTLEPRAATPARRLRTIRELTDAGVPVGVSVAPLIPFITEPDLERILEAAREAGAVYANYIVLRLPWEVRPLFQEWLQAHFPDRAERVMNRVREMRGGKDYDADFASRMRGTGIWADLIRQRFYKTADRLGFRYNRFELDTSQFRPPPRPTRSRAADVGQGSLF